MGEKSKKKADRARLAPPSAPVKAPAEGLEARASDAAAREAIDRVEHDTRLKRKDYDALLAPLELELNDMARWLAHTGQRVVVLFEGRDTAGKGGAIRSIADTLNPRQCRVVALPKPSERERTQWYFQRYVQHLPAAGEIALFDRSWYNRAGVERVMGYCTPEQTEAFLRQAPVFERMLVDDGVLLFKYWLTVDQAEQEARFAERLLDPLKRWKLSPIDLQARERYREYGLARDAMLEATHTPETPWTLVDFNDQKLGRLTLIRDLLDRLPDVELPAEPLPFPPLATAPRKESFKGPVKPLKPYPARRMLERLARTDRDGSSVKG